METKIFDYGMNGEGVAKIGGKIALIPFALVGEDVDIQIEQDNKNYCKAKIDKILKPSKNRATPPCPYFYTCGGCTLQHMSYSEQLKFKTGLIKKTIKKIAGIDCAVEDCVGSNKQYNYRNKISFAFDNHFGFYKFNSKDVVAVDECKIASENINKVLTLAQNFLEGYQQKNEIKNLVVRDIENQLLVGVVAKKFLRLGDFYAILAKNFKKIGLFLIINKRNDSVVLTKNCIHVGGIKDIQIENFGIKYSVDLLGFHQTNAIIQNEIYNSVLGLIEKDELSLKGKPKNIINGFSGAGLLSAILSKTGNNVFGIEIEKSSHLSAQKLKSCNKIKNLTNICGDFGNKIKNLTNICGDFGKEIKKLDVDILVLDPPKKGVGQPVLNEIVGAKDIIYISCNPIALAKDLRFLKNFYIIELVKPFDMFPNTISVETLVKLKFKN